MKKLLLLLLLLTIFNCSPTELDEGECVLFRIASVQYPADNPQFAIKFQEIDCDSCITTLFFDAEHYDYFVAKTGEEGCLEDLTQI